MSRNLKSIEKEYKEIKTQNLKVLEIAQSTIESLKVENKFLKDFQKNQLDILMSHSKEMASNEVLSKGVHDLEIVMRERMRNLLRLEENRSQDIIISKTEKILSLSKRLSKEEKARKSFEKFERQLREDLKIKLDFQDSQILNYQITTKEIEIGIHDI